METCSKNLNRLVLELGWKDIPMIILKDADLKRQRPYAVNGSLAKFQLEYVFLLREYMWKIKLQMNWNMYE